MNWWNCSKSTKLQWMLFLWPLEIISDRVICSVGITIFLLMRNIRDLFFLVWVPSCEFCCVPACSSYLSQVHPLSRRRAARHRAQDSCLHVHGLTPSRGLNVPFGVLIPIPLLRVSVMGTLPYVTCRVHRMWALIRSRRDTSPTPGGQLQLGPSIWARVSLSRWSSEWRWNWGKICSSTVWGLCSDMPLSGLRFYRVKRLLLKFWCVHEIKASLLFGFGVCAASHP